MQNKEYNTINCEVDFALQTIRSFEKSYKKSQIFVEFPHGLYDIENLSGDGEYIVNPELQDNHSGKTCFYGKPRLLRSICIGKDYYYVTLNKQIYKVEAFIEKNIDDSFKFIFKAVELSEHEKYIRQLISQRRKAHIEKMKLNKQKDFSKKSALDTNTEKESNIKNWHNLF